MDEDPLERIPLTFLLGLAFQVMLSEFVSRLNEAGYADLRPMHGLAFQALRGPGITSSELADRLGVTKQAAGQIVDDLEQRGYVRREAHPDGGRRRLVVLTDKAQRHLEVAGQVMYKLEAELEANLRDEDVARLRVNLAHIIRELVDESVPPLRPIW